MHRAGVFGSWHSASDLQMPSYVKGIHGLDLWLRNAGRSRSLRNGTFFESPASDILSSLASVFSGAFNRDFRCFDIAFAAFPTNTFHKTLTDGGGEDTSAPLAPPLPHSRRMNPQRVRTRHVPSGVRWGLPSRFGSPFRTAWRAPGEIYRRLPMIYPPVMK